VAYDIPRVINPDEIAKDMNPRDPDAASLAAARKALAQRRAALATGEKRLQSKQHSLDTLSECLLMMRRPPATT